MKLYYSPGACSLSPHILLNESGLPFEAVRASTKTHKLADGTDYYTINPRGYVPLLELDNGERMTEGPAIVQYIADQVPEKKLAPAHGTMPRYRLIEWLGFIGTELHKGFSPLFNPATPEDYKTGSVRPRLQNRYEWVDQQLAGKQFLVGDNLTGADTYLYVVTRWAKAMGFEIASLKNVAAHHDRIDARPATQAALKEEGLLKAQ